jgi:hypothetical protein
MAQVVRLPAYLQRPRLNTRPFYVGFVKDRVGTGTGISSSVAGFPLLVSFHQYSILIHAFIISAI